MLGNLLRTFCFLYSLVGKTNYKSTFPILDFVSKCNVGEYLIFIYIISLLIIYYLGQSGINTLGYCFTLKRDIVKFQQNEKQKNITLPEHYQ